MAQANFKSEILSARKTEQKQARPHTASHDVADEENLDESNEVVDTEGSAKRKTSSRVGFNQNTQLEASKKINMGSVLASNVTGIKLSKLLVADRTVRRGHESYNSPRNNREDKVEHRRISSALLNNV
jgi:hypothetical protein